jgi:hypothetical protein
MTTYRTKVSLEMLAWWKPEWMPATLRIVSVADQEPGENWRIVTFEDDQAPARLEGQLVTPLMEPRGDRFAVVMYQLQAL